LSSLASFLAELARKDIKVWSEGGQLRCNAPGRRLTPELREELQRRKAELLSFLEQQVAELREAPGDEASAGTPMIDRELPPPLAWRGADLSADAGHVPIPAACAEEIASLAATLRDNPLPLPALRPDDFDLPACRAVMQEARQALESGPAFAVIDRLDVAALGAEARAIHWLLASMLARPVALKWDGTMVRDVADQGRRSTRAVDTTDEMNFHTDNSFNVRPPRFVALLCLQKARRGGMSKLVNVATVHNELRRRRPELLERLYRPFHFDRQREHAPSERPTIRRPVFESRDGRPLARMSRFHVESGYAVAGEQLDADGAAALDALEAVMNEDGMAFEFWFEPGQIQIIDNRLLSHKRTGFEDWPEPERKRRLVRLWLRDCGRPFYNG
jgi:alpha-ketoglutarate-dependent taurine dioxygenase